jgi:hypothetical protein
MRASRWRVRTGDQRGRLLINTYRPGFPAFAEPDPERAEVEVDVAQFERERLADPQPAPPQHRDQGTVADPGRGAPATATQQRDGLGLGQRLRRPAPRPASWPLDCGVLFSASIALLTISVTLCGDSDSSPTET